MAVEYITPNVISSIKANVKISDFPFLGIKKTDNINEVFRLPKIKKVDDKIFSVVKFKNGVTAVIFNSFKSLDFDAQHDDNQFKRHEYINQFVETNSDLFGEEDFTHFLVAQHNKTLDKTMVIFHISKD